MHASANELNIVGLLMNLSGIILLFVFGMPFRVRTGGRPFMQLEGTNPETVSAERWHTFLGWLGFALIVLGTFAQIDANLLS
jgi:hypothetical protein